MLLKAEAGVLPLSRLVLGRLSLLRLSSVHARAQSGSGSECSCSRRCIVTTENGRGRGRSLISLRAAAASVPAPSGDGGPSRPSKDANGNPTSSEDSVALADSFCLIESRDSVKDFAALNLTEIEQNIEGRRNKIFLLMEEVRRLRIQQKIKAPENPVDVDVKREKYPSALPLLPPLSDTTLQTYYTVYAAIVATIILFGGLFAPVLEVRLGVGGTTYSEFIGSAHLPQQLAQVDPIVASFCGGAVGVLSALLLVEVNNAKAQAKRRCIYCEGLGYLTCGSCMGSGTVAATAPSTRCMCSYCSGTGKVMCTSCLCTGKQMATEHDPRIDPFV